jgi:predicted HTH domain antitoxin
LIAFQEIPLSLQLEIPDSVSQALRLPQAEQSLRLKTELALSLYAQGILSFGKARELSGLGKLEFGLLLGQRNIPRQYEASDLQDDLTYAGCQ